MIRLVCVLLLIGSTASARCGGPSLRDRLTPAQTASLNIAAAAAPERMMLMQTTLPELLDGETWQAVVAAARARGLAVPLLAKFQPWLLVMALSAPPCAMGDLVSGAAGLDHMLMDDAARNQVPQAALEPWDMLLTAVEDISLEQQAGLLQLSLQPPDIQAEMFVALLDAYFAENLGEMTALSRLFADYAPGMDRARAQQLYQFSETLLLTDRNANWVSVIETAAAQNPKLFVAVGAAHLPGRSGLLALLSARGWQIEPG
ncbi:MAG: TraB/GumN family protein [Rhodobacteraceae bacterium]|nr:TraB/GumN family protein [Paracoccaceae bacterium]